MFHCKLSILGYPHFREPSILGGNNLMITSLKAHHSGSGFFEHRDRRLASPVCSLRPVVWPLWSVKHGHDISHDFMFCPYYDGDGDRSEWSTKMGDYTTWPRNSGLLLCPNDLNDLAWLESIIQQAHHEFQCISIPCNLITPYHLAIPDHLVIPYHLILW